MQNLPVFEAVVEILQSFLMESENSVNLPISIGVDIKAKRQLQKYEAGCQVFYVRVCCNHGIDLQKGFQDNEYRRFGEMLMCMQTGETDGHLSVQRTACRGMPGSEQRVYWLEQGSRGRATLTCQHSKYNASIGSEASPFIIHFRVIQQESHIVSEGHRIHKYLHKLKLLKEKIDLSFSMKVCGAVCQTDFSVKNYIPVQKLSIAGDIRHFFGKECTRRLWCGGARAYTGDQVQITQCCGTPCTASSLRLAVFSIVSLLPLVERYPENQSAFGISGHVVINFFGPSEIALQCSDDYFKFLDASTLLNSDQFSLTLKDATAQIHGDVTLGATLTDLRYLPPWASPCSSFLLCVAVVLTDQESRPDRSRTHDIINSLQDDSKSINCVLRSAGKSISTCLNQIFVRRETEHEILYRSTYFQCTAIVTSSICDIFNHSIDPAFRSEMAHLLQANSKDTLNTNLAEKLNKIARIPKSAVPNCDSNEDDVIVWDKCSDNIQQSKIDSLSGTGIVPDQVSTFSRLVPSTTEATVHAANETEDELLDDIVQLNNFDQSIGIHSIQEHLLSVQVHSLPDPEPLPTPPASLDHFTEEDLTFFQHEFEIFDEDIPDVDDDGPSTDGQGLSGSVASVQTSTVQTPPPPQRQPTAHSPTGDEWMDDVMFDMSDWL